jgi:large conductance mechanosensitive channel
MNFVREQGVVGLAIGLAIGTQAKVLVDSIVASFINPLVGLLLPGQGNLSAKTFSFTLNEKTANFTYGSFLNVLISFIAVAAVIYFVVKGLKLDKLDKAKQD